MNITFFDSQVFADIKDWIPFFIAFISIIVSITVIVRKFVLPKSIGLVTKSLAVSISIVLFLAVILFLPIDMEMKEKMIGAIFTLFSIPMFALGTTPAKNVLAGITIRVRKTFAPKDIIKIDDIRGWVEDVGLTRTIIKTENGALVKEPNKNLGENRIKVVPRKNPYIYAEFGLGYGTNKELIKKVLVKAAEKVGLKKPAVSIKMAENFTTLYRIGGFLDDTTNYFTQIYILREACIDFLHQSNIEVASPSLIDIRMLDASTQHLHTPKKVVVGNENLEAQEEIFQDAAKKKEKEIQLKTSIKEAHKEIEELEKELSKMNKVESLNKEIEKLENDKKAAKTAHEANKAEGLKNYNTSDEDVKKIIAGKNEEIMKIKASIKEVERIEKKIKALHSKIESKEQGIKKYQECEGIDIK